MTTAHGQSLMLPGQYLEPGEMLVSSNGIYKLLYTKDGLLELSAKTRESPETWTITWKYDLGPKENPGLCRLRQDGTFVVRSFNDKDGEPVPAGWFPEGYQCQPGGKLVLRMQDDGNLVAYDDTETAYWSTNTWTARYAVLIGVNEYTNVSDKNLKAGCNDVLDMWKLCRRLGYRPEHIRVCTSPMLAREQIEAAEREAALGRPENSGKSEAEVKPSVEKDLASAEAFWTEILGGATYEDITTAVGWLWLKLAEPFAKGTGYAVPGILYYSGHGTKVDGNLALCPADVHEDSDKNALPFDEITEVFATEFKENNGHNPMEYLTVILDCCFAAAQEADGASKTQVVTTLKRPDTAKAAAEPSDIHPWLQRRVFCATRDNEPGYQALLGGRWHGAFTWALTRTLEQWTNQHSSAAFPYINISQAELLMRARMLLEALGFRQHPVLMDTFANTPMFWSGLARVETRAAGTAPKTSAEPDAERAGIQMDFGSDPYRVYEFSQNGSVFASVLVVGTATTINGIAYAAGTEYWSIEADPVLGANITITCTPGTAWGDVPALPAKFPAAASSLIVSTSCKPNWGGAASTTLTNVWKTDNGYLSWVNSMPLWSVLNSENAIVTRDTTTLTYTQSATATVKAATFTYPVLSVAGTWDWIVNGEKFASPVTLNLDGTGRDATGHKCTWKVSGSLVTLTWEDARHFDTLTILTDRKSITGKNSGNVPVTGVLHRITL